MKEVKADRDLYRRLLSAASSGIEKKSELLAETLALMPAMTDPTCTILDGMALLQAIGKPADATNFGDLADIFAMNVFSHFSSTCTRVDVVFDMYKTVSAKADTRIHRAGKSQKIPWIVD